EQGEDAEDRRSEEGPEDRDLDPEAVAEVQEPHDPQTGHLRAERAAGQDRWTSPETPQIAKLPRRAALGFGYTEISRAAPAVPEQAAITIPVIRPWQYLGRYATPEHSPSPCTRSCAGQPWPERVASCPPGETVSRTIDRFLLHKAPSKHRIFALVLD